jgi:two-component system LytT family response regulator
MQINCAVIDDEPYAVQLMKDYIQKFPVLNLVRAFDDGVDAAAFLNDTSVDLIFLEIDMPAISGFDLLRLLKIKPMTIFTTAYKKYAIEGFELDVLDYLLKPIAFNRFCKSVTKVVEYYEFRNYFRNKQHECLVVRSEYKLLKIDLSDIEYIESVEDYCKIYLSSGRPVLTLMPLKTLLEKLPANKFKRIHRSYIAPIEKVKAVINRRAQLTSAELPISDSYIGFVQEWMRK